MNDAPKSILDDLTPEEINKIPTSALIAANRDGIGEDEAVKIAVKQIQGSNYGSDTWQKILKEG